MAERCSLCGRRFNSTDGRYPVGEPENHHQPPITFKKRKWYKTNKYPVCSHCHKQIHRVFTNKELAKIDFNEMPNHPRLQSYLKWITKFDVNHFLQTHDLDSVSIEVSIKKKRIVISGSDIVDIGFFYVQTGRDFIYNSQIHDIKYDGQLIWER